MAQAGRPARRSPLAPRSIATKRGTLAQSARALDRRVRGQSRLYPLGRARPREKRGRAIGRQSTRTRDGGVRVALCPVWLSLVQQNTPRATRSMPKLSSSRVAAAKRKACWRSSGSRKGYSASSVARSGYVASSSRTRRTVIRIIRMHGFPPHFPGSTVIRSNKSTVAIYPV